MLASRFPRRNYKRGRLHASVSALALDPRSVLHCAGADFQIDAAPDQPGAPLSQPDRFLQHIHRGLLSDAQTFAPGPSIVTEKKAGDFS